MREARQRRTSGLSGRRLSESPRDTDTRLNKRRHEADFSKTQGYALALLILVITGTIFGLWLSGNANPLFHSIVQNPACPLSMRINGQCDPPSQVVLWRATSPNNDLGEYNTLLASYTTNTPTGTAGINLAANSTTTAVALTKQPIDISSVNGKQLWIGMEWDAKLFGSCCGTNLDFGWYLTTNQTLPTQHSYDPYKDQSVNLLFRIVPVSSTSANDFLFIIRKPTTSDTLFSEDEGCATSGNGGSGSVFICATATGLNPVAQEIPAYMGNLNFTGGGATQSDCTSVSYTGTGCSNIQVGVHSATSVFPTLTTSSLYYVGFYSISGNTFHPTFLFSTGSLATEVSMFAYQTVATPNPVPISPTVDTGGFFGAVGRFLAPAANILSGTASAVWGAISNPLAGIAGALLNAINSAISIISTVVKTILNTVGNFFGLGNVGDDLVSFFNGIVNWLTNVFGGIIGQIGNIASGIGNGVTAIVNIFSDFGTQAISFLSTITGLPALILTIWNDFLPAAYAISFVVLLWWLFGFYQAWRDWNSGDIVGFLMCMIMFGGVVLILGSTTAINPIAANTTVQGIYAQGFTNIGFLFLLLMPIFLVQVFSHWGSSQDRGDRTGHTTLQHWQSWARTTEFFGMKLFQVSFIVAKESWTVIVSIKQLVAGWL